MKRPFVLRLYNEDSLANIMSFPSLLFTLIGLSYLSNYVSQAAIPAKPFNYSLPWIQIGTHLGRTFTP